MSEEMIPVRIDTNAEDYPVLHVSEEEDPQPDDWRIPADLLRQLREAYTVVGEAELAIMRYVAEHNPDALFAREWLGINDEQAAHPE